MTGAFHAPKRLSMTATSPEGNAGKIAAVILDIDGVVLDSPHEAAWRAALAGFADPAGFTAAFYQAHVAGKPRMAGARAALEGLGVADAGRLAAAYAAAKQARIVAMIEAGEFAAFPDAVRFMQAVLARGLRLAAASSSRNAAGMLRRVAVAPGRSLMDLFAVDACGRDLAHGKPEPEIFLIAAAELGEQPARCLVVEDAPAGIQAAVAGGMRGLGVARSTGAGHAAEVAGLRAAGAALVVGSLDEVAVNGLPYGRLRRDSHQER